MLLFCFSAVQVQYLCLVHEINSFNVYINSIGKMLNETNDCQNFTQNFIYPPLEWNLKRSIKSIIFGSIVVATVVGNFFSFVCIYSLSKTIETAGTFFFLADFLVGVGSLPFLAVRSVTERWAFCFY